MPKRARYPLFLSGLAVIIAGSIFLSYQGAGTGAIAALVAFGFLLLFLSVAIR
jgi:hypothetical protein